jgi:hypothetical protein
MGDCTAQDLIDFEALPEEVQALARRVVRFDREEAYDEGYRDGLAEMRGK